MKFATSIGISDVEAKQRVAGTSGTSWEIDAKGVVDNGEGFLIIECKQRSSARIDQETIAGLAYRVQDVRASGAILVTSIGLQEGAQKIAAHEGFHIVYLPTESTFDQFVAKCGKMVLMQMLPMSATVSVALVSAKLERVVNPRLQ